MRTRLSLDKDFLEAIRYGFSLIVAGFGSFSLFEGLTIGEREVAPLPRTFALVVTAVGVIVILLAVQHARKMTAWVDADEYGTGPTPELPNENRTLHLATPPSSSGSSLSLPCCCCRREPTWQRQLLTDRQRL